MQASREVKPRTSEPFTNVKKHVAFYISGPIEEHIPRSPRVREYIANLNTLKKHSKFFAEHFVTGNERCDLDIADYNVDNEFAIILKIMRLLDTLEMACPESTAADALTGGMVDAIENEMGINSFPGTRVTSPIDGKESFTRLFDLWQCGNQIRSTSVTHFLVVVIFRRTRVALQCLSTDEFNEYWDRTNEDDHGTLRQIMIAVIMMSPCFEDSRELRSQYLEELPDEIKEPMIHLMMEHRSEVVKIDKFVSIYD